MREGHRARRRTSALAAAACAWAGLASATGEAEAQRVIELPLEDRILTEDFPEVYRVGDHGREWELFSSLTSVGFDARGRLHIADLVGDELRIVVVDSTGALVSAFGRQGDGPGEFRDAHQAFALADGRTVVPDRAHFGYHLFTADGEFERMVRFEGVGPAHDLPLAMTPSANPRDYKSDYRGGLLSRVTSAWQVQVGRAGGSSSRIRPPTPSELSSLATARAASSRVRSRPDAGTTETEGRSSNRSRPGRERKWSGEAPPPSWPV